MDSIGVVQAQQGVVNQGNRTSAQIQKERGETGTGDPETVAVTAEFKARVEQILSDLKKQGVNPSRIPEKSNDPPPRAPHTESYINVLRDLLVGDTTVTKLTFDSFAREQIATNVLPKLPMYPFDRTFLQVHLEYLKALVSGEGLIDKNLAGRIDKQINELNSVDQSAGTQGRDAASQNFLD